MSCLQKICRLCLAGKEFSNIFSTQIEGLPATNLVKHLSGIEISPQDDAKLPNLICTTCIAILIKLVQFQVTCINSDETLRQVLPKAEENPDIPPTLVPEIELGDDSKTDVDAPQEDIRKLNLPSTSKEEIQEFWTPQDETEQQQQLHENYDKNKICTICNISVPENEMKLHMMNNHTKKTSLFKCKYCNMTFLLNNNLQQHLLNHIMQPSKRKNQDNNSPLIGNIRNENSATPTKKTYECVPCKRKFIEKSTYNFHLQRHRNKT